MPRNVIWNVMRMNRKGEERLAGSSWNRSSRRRERLLSSISTGFFLALVGLVFIFTPYLSERIFDFLRDLIISPVPHLGISLPAPEFPGIHLTVYLAAQRFCLIWGLFQVFILALRFVLHSPVRTRVETFASIIYWLGSAFLVQKMLIETAAWFEYWATIIMLFGLSLLSRAVFLVAWRQNLRG